MANKMPSQERNMPEEQNLEDAFTIQYKREDGSRDSPSDNEESSEEWQEPEDLHPPPPRECRLGSPDLDYVPDDEVPEEEVSYQRYISTFLENCLLHFFN